MSRPPWYTVAVAACLALLVALSALPVRAQGPEFVTLRLDWVLISYHMPFFLAAARGYYKDEKLAVTIQEGKGSSGTIQLVGNGADTFGLADAAVVAKAIGTGIPVKMVLGVLRKSSMSLVFPAESDIRTPQDLKGKRISTCAGQATGVLVPAYLHAVGLSPADVKMVNTQCGPPIYQAVAQKQADASATYTPAAKTYLKALGVPNVRSFEFADAGVLLPAHGIVASLKTIETKPDLVRRFVAATVKGWLDARRDPDAAVEATVAAMPLMKGKEAIFKAEFEEYLKYLDTPNTAGKSFGWQSPEDWKRAEAVLAQYMDLKRQAAVDAYFTNEFLPK